MRRDQTLTASSTIVAIQDQVATDLNDEVIILNVASGKYYSLTGTAPTIWGLIQEPRPVSEIRAALEAAYDVTPERCQHDVMALLQNLALAGLITVQA